MADDIIKSSYNEASYRMQRIDGIKKELDFMWLNPLGLEPTVRKPYYEFIVSRLLCLIPICWGKLTPEEKIQTEKYRDEILDDIENKQIFVSLKVNGLDGQKSNRMIDKTVWQDLRRKLFNFQYYLEDLFEIHELNTPNQEGDEGGYD